jgi:hypothetical protein
MGFGFIIGFIAHLYIQLIATSNYSVIANSHTPTTTHTIIHYSKHTPKSSQSVFSGYLIMAGIPFSQGSLNGPWPQFTSF